MSGCLDVDGVIHLVFWKGMVVSDRSFNAGEPIAFFVTWTCYGSWLPGDARGWHRWREGGEQQPNEFLHAVADARMKEPGFLMSQQDRDVVQATVVSHCELRRWTCYVVNARSNHVHVVVAAPGYNPQVVRNQFKSWCTRKLRPSHTGRKRFWTEGGSCRSINCQDDLESAVQYAGEAQDKKDRDE